MRAPHVPHRPFHDPNNVPALQTHTHACCTRTPELQVQRRSNTEEEPATHHTVVGHIAFAYLLLSSPIFSYLASYAMPHRSGHCLLRRVPRKARIIAYHRVSLWILMREAPLTAIAGAVFRADAATDGTQTCSCVLPDFNIPQSSITMSPPPLPRALLNRWASSSAK